MDTKQKIILSILMLGTLMGALDSTIVILAFPTISSSLHSDMLTAIWIILVYLLVVAVCTTQLGRIGDIYGRSRMFNTGFVIFTLGSLFCGLSSTIKLLIVSRIIQALGGALMQANSGAIVADTFLPNVRGKAFGYISLGWTSGAMLGIVLGGIITTFVGWEYIFFINIPIGIIASVLGYIYIRDTVHIKAYLDTIGMLLLSMALALMSYAAVDFASEGLASYNTTLFVIGIVFGLAFIRYGTYTSHPIIDFSSLDNHVLKYSIIAAFFFNLGYLSIVFLITMYLQGVRSLSPLDASLLLIPGYVAGSLLSPFMGELSDRYGARIIATLGCAFTIIATMIYLMLRVDTLLYFVLVASAISGIGTSMFFPANNSAVMVSAPAAVYGGISGTLRTVQNIGILGSFVVSITVASAAIPRNVAFEVFIGTTNLVGGLSTAFIKGVDSALIVSIIIIAIAGVMSWMRGTEKRGENIIR